MVWQPAYIHRRQQKESFTIKQVDYNCGTKTLSRNQKPKYTLVSLTQKNTSFFSTANLTRTKTNALHSISHDTKKTTLYIISQGLVVYLYTFTKLSSTRKRIQESFAQQYYTTCPTLIGVLVVVGFLVQQGNSSQTLTNLHFGLNQIKLHKPNSNITSSQPLRAITNYEHQSSPSNA